MSNKKVTITLVDLDITQLTKILNSISKEECDLHSVQGAYHYELRELVESIVVAGRSNKKVIKAPELTIY